MILNEKAIVEAVCEGIISAGSHSLEAFFHCLVAVAKDYGADFAKHFSTSMHSLSLCLEKVSELEATQVESGFCCIASICVILRRSCRISIAHILDLTRQLRHHEKQICRKLAAQAVAPTIRSSGEDVLFKAVNDVVAECVFRERGSNMHAVESCTWLIHYIMIGPGNELHSKANVVLRALLDFDLPPAFEADPLRFRAALFDSVIVSLDATLPKCGFAEMWKLLLSFADSYSMWNNHTSVLRAQYFARVLASVCATRFEICLQRQESISHFILGYASFCLQEVSSNEQHVSNAHLVRLLASLSSRAEFENLPAWRTLPWNEFVNTMKDDSVQMLLTTLSQSLDNGCVTASRIAQPLVKHAASFIITRGFDLAYALSCVILKLKAFGTVRQLKQNGVNRTLIMQYLQRRQTEGDVANVWAILRILPYLDPSVATRNFISEVVASLQPNVQSKRQSAFSNRELALLLASLEAEKICLELNFSPELARTDELLQMVLSRPASTSPAIWSKLTTLLSRNKITIDRFRGKLFTKDLIQSLGSRSRFLRVSVLEYLSVISEISPGLDTFPSVPEGVISTFLHINQLSLSSCDILKYSRKSVNSLKSLSQKLENWDSELCDWLVLLYMALGVLHLRFNPLWEPVADIIGFIVGRDHRAYHLVQTEIIRITDGLISATCEVDMRTPSSDDGTIPPEVYEALNPQEQATDNKQLLNSLLSSLKRAKRMDVGFVKCLFMDICQAARSGSSRYASPRFTDALRTLLTIMSENEHMRLALLASDSEAERKDIILAVKKLVGDENTEVATAALICMGRWGFEYLPESSVTHLRLLIDPTSVKRGLSALLFEGDDLISVGQFPAIREEHRRDVVELIVRILSKYILSTKSQLNAFRSTVLRWFGLLLSSELEPFMLEILSPFSAAGCEVPCETSMSEFLWNEEFENSIRSILPNIPHHELLSFVLHIQGMQKTVPSHMKRLAHTVSSFVFQTFIHSCRLSIDCMSAESTRWPLIRSKSLQVVACLVPYLTAEVVQFQWRAAHEHVLALAQGVVNECVTSRSLPVLEFIASIARCVELANILEQVDGCKIVEHTFGILKCEKATPGSRAVVLGMISDLLNYAESDACSDYRRSTIFVLHEQAVESVRASLICTLERQCISATTKAQDYEHMEVELLQRLQEVRPSHLWDGRQVERVILLMCTRGVPDAKRTVLLATLRSMLEHADLDGTNKLEAVKKLAPFLAHVRARTTRKALLDVFGIIYSPNDCSISERLQALNSYVDGHIEEVDHTRRVSAYRELQLCWSAHRASICLWLNNAIYDLCSSDVTVQNAAKSFIHNCLAELASKANTVVALTKPVVDSAAEIILLGVARMLKSSDLLVRNTGLEVLREAIRQNHLNELQCLCAANTEEDILLNMSHIQPHRRARGIRRLQESGTLSSIPQTSHMIYIFPVLKSFLADPNANVAATAADTMGRLAGVLEAPSCLECVCQLLRLAQRRTAFQAYYLRGASCMIDGLSINSRTQLSAKCQNSDVNQGNAGSGELRALYSKALLMAESCITIHSNSSSGHKLSVEYLQTNAISCVCSLLPFLPEDQLTDGLIRVLKVVNRNMISRSQKLIDNAMTALKVVSNKLGDKHLWFIVHFLRSGRTSSAELHVLMKAIYVLISSCPQLKSEIATALALEIVPWVRSILFTDKNELSNSKHARGEGKVVYSLKTITLLTAALNEHITFVRCLRVFMVALPIPPIGKMQQHFELLLHAFYDGVVRNPNISTEQYISLAGSIIEEYALNAILGTTDQVLASRTETRLPVEYGAKVYQFAVSLLQVALKHVHLQDSSYVRSQSLDDACRLMTRCFLSTSYDIRFGAARILLQLLRCAHAEKIIERNSKTLLNLVLSTLRSCDSVEDVLAQHCIRMIVLMMKKDYLTLTSTQLAFLLSFSFQNLQMSAASCKPSFVFLNLLISRRVVLLDVYVLMDQLLTTLTRGHSGQLRSMCSSALVRFISSYPLGSRKVDDIFHRLISSLECANPEGRISVLSTIHGILSKVPDSILESHGAVFFLPLVLRIANEEVTDCRRSAAKVVDCLFDRAHDTQVDMFLDCAKQWSQQVVSRDLQQAAFQILFIGFLRRPHATFAAFSTIEEHCIRSLRELLLNDTDWSWSTAYSLLSCLEKSFEHRDLGSMRTISTESDAAIIALLPSAMLHEHIWVKSCAFRVLKFYLHHAFQQKCSFRILLAEFGDLLLDGLLVNADLASHCGMFEPAALQDIFYCITRIMTTLSAHFISQQRFMSISGRLRRLAATSNLKVRCAVLQLTAALVSSNTSDGLRDAILFHTILLCEDCLAQHQMSSCAEVAQTQSLAREMLASLQQMLPHDSFTSILKRVKSHRSV